MHIKTVLKYNILVKVRSYFSPVEQEGNALVKGNIASATAGDKFFLMIIHKLYQLHTRTIIVVSQIKA